MKSGRPKFSVVIPTCGRESLLDCLRALAGQSYSDFEVVAVDDGSPKPVASMAGIREIPVELRILRQEQSGPSVARNRGAAEARGEFLAFTDDDCLAEPHWLATLLGELEKVPNALCGTLTFNGLPRQLWTATSQFIIDLVYAHFNRDPGQAYFLASNNIACRRDLFLGLGGFDTSFPKAGAEDREFCDRWRMSGNPLRLVQKPLLQHRHSQSLAKFVDLHMRYGRGAFRYQAIRRARGSGTMKQDAAFHTSLPTLLRTLLPRQGGIGRQAGILFGLLLWQIINTLGFAAAFLEARSLSG
jgi:glycosyltransferase involved in cell wall biosynthesis